MNTPLPEAGAWIRRFRPVDDPICRLLCLPHAGASVGAFFALSRGLAELHGIEALAVQYPGRQDRRAEAGCADLVTIARAVAAELPGWLDRPYAVLGHSMGATVGFELARVMEAEAVGPFRLLVSGQRCPALQTSAPVHALTDEQLVREMVRLGGTSAVLLSDPDLLRMVLPPMRGDYAALSRYLYRPEPPMRIDERMAIDG